jgi:oligoribonuclease NrnB/cAMP/cGMP phosphodiesterase (DHH superfamily)
MSGMICFHHVDADGHASGAIVRLALGGNVQLVETDYDDRPIPWDLVETSSRVIITDFSFPLQDMQRMAEGRELIWIDHHKTAISELIEVSRGWPGLRDLSEAACVLTWKYFFPDRPVPRPVLLIGDRDIWRWAYAETAAFNEGLYVRDTSPENDDLWVPLLHEDPVLIQDIIAEGSRLHEIRLAQIDARIDRSSFEVEFEGHRTLVINSAGSGDLGQRGRERGYEIVYCYEDQMRNDELMTFVNLYSKRVDVSLIAHKYGGGGHVGAAGFSFPRSFTPFPPDSHVKWKRNN